MTVAERDIPRMCFYGDDFTGSTDALAELAKAGLTAILFLNPPSIDDLKGKYPDFSCIGVAGIGRTLSPDQMRQQLPRMLEPMSRYGFPLMHYKICSTFDSSPNVGSIGRALEIGLSLYPERTAVPLVAGAPQLGRYTVFGQHFAVLNGVTHRLDRHPVVSRHPVTPMREGDLRVVLAEQTDLPVRLVDLHDQELEDEKLGLRAALGGKPESADVQAKEIVLFDVLDIPRLRKVGRLLWKEARERPLFVAGSSGVELALIEYWKEAGLIGGEPAKLAGTRKSAEKSSTPLLVISGSASGITANQIGHALDHGFIGVRFPVEETLLRNDTGATARALKEAETHLMLGKSVVLYTSLGPDDRCYLHTQDVLRVSGAPPADSGRRLGQLLGRTAKELIRRRGLRRIVFAGGDISGHAVSELGIEAMEVTALVAPGAPMCRCHADKGSPMNGLEIALKGGQLGQEDYFTRVHAL